MSVFSAVVFLVLGCLWGSSFIYMQMAAESISALQTVFYRVVFGFLPLLIWALVAKVMKLEHLKHTHHFLVMAVLTAIVNYYCFAVGSDLLPSGIAGALSGAIPLFSCLLALFFLKEERLTLGKISGIVLGFLGLILVTGVVEHGVEGTSVEGAIAVMIGSISVGASFIYAKRFVIPLKIPALASTTYSLGLASLILLLITPKAGITDICADLPVFLGVVIGLGAFATGFAYIMYYYLVQTIGAIRASSSTYIPPVVALVLGYIFAGETIGIYEIVGTALIFAGVYLIGKK